MIAGSVAVGWWLFATAPQQETTPSTPTLPTVEVIEANPGSVEVKIRGFGEVVPARSVSIAPEVTGRVTEVGDGVEPGGLLAAGALLFKMDPQEYDAAVKEAEADLAQAQAELELEKGRGLVARQEWQRL
ncbi:MAG: hypothetical protein AAGK21_16180, partial [Bacteroidota bacterium]